ncbi:hypothetical protein [Bowmanella yangjiangensis]|uniref:Uncharacterized protein n=1 Tax=Bowmanella yangjiangensis TaxID=2811230 RepID=A0ABS3CMZ6_9ALTE|nr:hypothetical protein [Bowmanella yangjiangensis]MBN7818487.1 hypothetical protein [Bowmanella yangjiangensis]
MQSEYIAHDFKASPLQFLIKLMDLSLYASELQELDSSLNILTGLVSFRSLDRLRKSQILSLINAIPPGRLLAKIHPMPAQIIANPYWYCWSLTDQELREYYEYNRDFSKSLETLGVNFGSITAIGIAGLLVDLSKSGFASMTGNTVRNVSSYNKLMDTTRKLGISGGVARNIGFAGAFVSVLLGCLHAGAQSAREDALKELSIRGLVTLKDF